MKQTENYEIDLLLRGLARHGRAGSAAPEDHATMHLDADELNAYAEQALPAEARARYTSHLADCASCRKIVSELTSALGANVREQSVSHKSSAGLRQKLGALFSPQVFRYAVPALALLAFVAIGLVVIRQQNRSDFVAQNQPTLNREVANETPAEPGDAAAAIGEGQTSESQNSAGKVRNNQANASGRDETSNTAKATDSVTVTADKNDSAGKAAGAVAQPSYAPEPAAAPPAKPETSQTESRTEVAARQKEVTDKKDQPAREQEGTRVGSADSQNEVARAAPGVGTLASQSQERSRKLEAKRASGAEEKADDDEVDTRTVSGRRFRRQRGVWIDTAYQSSTAPTNVARGSEQFRALTADEPGIRAIAAQLPGEVVVVWKGRAYRIR